MRNNRNDRNFRPDRSERDESRYGSQDFNRGRMEPRRPSNPESEGWSTQGSPNYGRFDNEHGFHEPQRSERDVDYGTRHWGQGEFDRGADRDAAGRVSHDKNVFERTGEAVGRFFGVGPKGYKRSDDRIKEDVCECLSRHHEIDASDIEVDVKDGTVSLIGTIDTRQIKRMVEDEIDHVSGVRDVINNLRLKTLDNKTDTTKKSGKLQ